MSIKGKILIASGDKKNIQTLKNILTPLKYDISSYKDLKKLRDDIQSENPDLLILDADGLDGDSYAFSKSLKNTIFPKLPILMMTNATFDQNLVKLLKDSKITEYLRKPVSYSLLLEKVKKLLLVDNVPLDFVFDDSQEFEFAGSVAKITLPRILYFLKRDARTGILSITRDIVKKVISFEGGDPKFVVSNIVQECLGRLLVAKGRLTSEECEESLKLMKEWKKKQGETLIRMGLIEPYELDETLKMQARERLLEALGWQDGEYKFFVKKFLREDLTPLDIAIPQIVLLGVRRYYMLDVLKKIVDRWLDHIPVFNRNSFFKVEEFKLATWDAKTVRLFDGKRTFREIVGERIVREIDVYHLVFVFYVLSLLKFRESDITKQIAEDEISREIEQMRNLNPFQILNVDYGASDEEIRRRFDSLLLEYSQAKTKANKARLERIEEAIETLKEAYDAIKDRGLRMIFLKRLFLEEGVLAKETREVVTTNDILNKGKDFLAKKDYPKAKLLFLNGINIFPKVGPLYSHLGYSIFLSVGKNKEKSSENLEEAAKYMKKGLVLSPEEEECHLFYGKLLKYLGREEEAKREFKKVTQINSDNIEALQELRLSGIRERKKSTSFIKWKK